MLGRESSGGWFWDRGGGEDRERKRWVDRVKEDMRTKVGDRRGCAGKS